MDGIEGRSTASEQSVEAWFTVVGSVPFDKALAGAKRHYESNSRRLYPADLIKSHRENEKVVTVSEMNARKAEVMAETEARHLAGIEARNA